MTSIEISKKIINELIPNDFGKSFDDLKKDVFYNYKKNNYGCSDHFKSENGYSVFYTDNKNFMNGIKTGGGSGYFARLQGVGSTSTVKLSS